VLHNIDEVNAARVGLGKRKKERKKRREKREKARWEWECELRRKFGLLRYSDSKQAWEDNGEGR
jgi:hypothetical protein